jgi:hypothetical protein
MTSSHRDLPAKVDGHKPMMQRRPRSSWRTICDALLFGGLCFLVVPSPASAQSVYPSRAVTLVLPFPAGGLADAALRRMANRRSELWTVPVVVDNRPGAGRFLGASISHRGSRRDPDADSVP